MHHLSLCDEMLHPDPLPMKQVRRRFSRIFPARYSNRRALTIPAQKMSATLA
jgi:hypothetical protein